MQFTTVFLTAIVALTVTAAPQRGGQGAPNTNAQGAPNAEGAPNAGGQGVPNAGAIAALVPEFGVTPGQSPDGKGNCVTPVAPAKIACDCPPPRDEYLSQLTAAVQAGNTFGSPADFPTGSDTQSQIIRFQTMLAVMQSVKGAKGKGCPAISTTFKKSLDALTGAPPAPNAG
jgi:hypothetical protein